MDDSLHVPAAVREFDDADLGHATRTARLLKVAEVLARQPSASFPKAAGSDTELEGLYRVLSNGRVGWEQILEPHQRKSAERCAGSDVVVVHDTTEFQMVHADPDEVGYLQTGKPGFYAHVSLAVSSDGERRPLGVVALQTLFRSQRSRRGGRGSTRSGSTTTKQPDRESLRWEAGVAQSAALLADARPIHVADREADSYTLLAQMHGQGSRFVVRLRHDRNARRVQDALDADVPWSRLKDLITSANACLEREVPLSRRAAKTAPRASRSHPKRAGRVAKLCFAATRLELKRPRYFDEALPATLPVNCVRVYEIDVPEGEDPIEWLLFTTESVETAADIARVVDLYRTRWVIEEFFKALKTGCIYEERQLESRHALLNALAIFMPIACTMLWLRSRAQHAPHAPATEVITATQLSVLRAFARRPIPKNPTARDVLWAIAGLGGHLKSNGEPGWASIRHGFERLLDFELGWRAAQKHSRKRDQS
jgi:hypothetical protein